MTTELYSLWLSLTNHFHKNLDCNYQHELYKCVEISQTHHNISTVNCRSKIWIRISEFNNLCFMPPKQFFDNLKYIHEIFLQYIHEIMQQHWVVARAWVSMSIWYLQVTLIDEEERVLGARVVQVIQRSCQEGHLPSNHVAGILRTERL